MAVWSLHHGYVKATAAGDGPPMASRRASALKLITCGDPTEGSEGGGMEADRDPSDGVGGGDEPEDGQQGAEGHEVVGASSAAHEQPPGGPTRLDGETLRGQG